jgi:hypothetical protein
MYSTLPKSTEAQVLGKQVLRSGTSGAANYLEAIGQDLNQTSSPKLGDCLKELDETDYWLELLAQSSIVPDMKETCPPSGRMRSTPCDLHHRLKESEGSSFMIPSFIIHHS